MKRWSVVMLAVGCLCSTVRAGDSAGHWGTSRAILRGAIDIHVHCHPDNVPRSLDGLEAARFAKDKGMRAIVLKSHFDPTAGLALLARKAVPGIEVFGGVDLNLPVGGMNPHAVEHMVRVNGGWGRMVWMSTFDAENQIRTEQVEGAVRPGLAERRAAARNEGRHCRHRQTQSGAGERSRVGAGSAADVRRRPPAWCSRHGGDARHVGADLADGRAGTAGRRSSARSSSSPAARWQRRTRRQESIGIADDIRKVGIEHAILSSDLGQAGNPLPADGYATYHGGVAQERVHRSGARSDGQRESVAAAGASVGDRRIVDARASALVVFSILAVAWSARRRARRRIRRSFSTRQSGPSSPPMR